MTPKYSLAELVKGRTRRKEIKLRAFTTPRQLEALPRDIAFAVIRELREAAKSELLDLIETAQGSIQRDDVSGLGAFFDREDGKVAGLLIRLTPDLQKWAVGIERWHRRKFAGSVKAGTGIDVESFMVPATALPEIGAYQQWAAGLIRSVSDDLRKEMRTIAYNAVVEGTPRREVAKQLTERFGIARNRAVIIARDQTTKLAGKLDELRNIEAGITRYEWVHSGKANPRPEHVERDGKVYEWAKPPSDGHPGTAINCGCTSKAILEL